MLLELGAGCDQECRSSNPGNNGCFTVSTPTKSQPFANCTRAQTNQGIRLVLELAEEIDGGGGLLGAAQEGFWGEQRTGVRKKKLCGPDSLQKNSVYAVVTTGELKPGSRKGGR